MGLLAKTNPTATRESVIEHAWIWGSIGAIACLAYCLWIQPSFSGWPLLVPLAGIAGAGLGGLMEWQVDDGVEILYVVQEVEDEFGVKIPDWDVIDTVDDLYRRTLNQLRCGGDTNIDEHDIWRRLHALLVRQFGFRPEKVAPSARFYIDLPM